MSAGLHRRSDRPRVQWEIGPRLACPGLLPDRTRGHLGSICVGRCLPSTSISSSQPDHRAWVTGAHGSEQGRAVPSEVKAKRRWAQAPMAGPPPVPVVAAVVPLPLCECRQAPPRTWGNPAGLLAPRLSKPRPAQGARPTSEGTWPVPPPCAHFWSPSLSWFLTAPSAQSCSQRRGAGGGGF